MNDLVFQVSDFVAVFNQTVEHIYPSVVIEGELANLRVSKGRWVYFDLKDELSSIKFFGTVYQLPGPLEDGMVLRVMGSPRLHPQYGFSITIQQIELAGEGTIKRASELLKRKLTTEGLFDVERKRAVPYPPTIIGLVTSGESAAYADFIKILGARWQGLQIQLRDVQVQGLQAVSQIVNAIDEFNGQKNLPDVLVMIRGGGSPEDLAAFSDERVVRAIAASRIPTLVAIGHEVDESLAELAADLRASTPSNAAELLVPDRNAEQKRLQSADQSLKDALNSVLQARKITLTSQQKLLTSVVDHRIHNERQRLIANQRLLEALSPRAVLERGYSVVRTAAGKIVTKSASLKLGEELSIELKSGKVQTTVSKLLQ